MLIAAIQDYITAGGPADFLPVHYYGDSSTGMIGFLVRATEHLQDITAEASPSAERDDQQVPHAGPLGNRVCLPDLAEWRCGCMLG